MVDVRQIANKFIQNTGKINVPADNRLDRTDRCNVIWYQWVLDQEGAPFPNLINPTNPADFIPDKALNVTRSFDISNHLSSFTFTKAMGQASGTWEMVLEDSLEWDKYIKPGQWIVSLMSSNDLTVFPPQESQLQGNPLNTAVTDFSADLLGSAAAPFTGKINLAPTPPGIPERSFSFGALLPVRDKIRTIGVVTRVGITSTVDENGTEIIQYKVSGKDFGIVYEDTRLWLNFVSQDSTSYNALVKTLLPAGETNLGVWMKVWYSLFMNPELLTFGDQAKINAAKSLIQAARQWILPQGLINDFGLELFKTSVLGDHFGSLASVQLEMADSPFGVGKDDIFTPNMGSMWDKLTELSQPEFHELFTELGEDGTPKIFFRPIPFSRAENTPSYPTLAPVIMTFGELSSDSPLTRALFSFEKGLGAALLEVIETAIASITGAKRVVHRVDVHPLEIETYDIGPSFEERYNQFMADVNTSPLTKQTSLATLQKFFKASFPLRDPISIKRNGFRPLHLSNLRMYRTSLIGDFLKLASELPANKAITPDTLFLIELNHLLMDYYAGAQNYYSGTVTIAGKNQIRLGKTLVIDRSAKKIGNFVFYIEGYTDHFQVDENGAGTWTQTVQVTRGQNLANIGPFAAVNGLLDQLTDFLEQGGTFHVDTGNS